MKRTFGGSLQSVLTQLKRFDEAFTLLSEALDLRVALFGDQHHGMQKQLL